MTNPYIKVLKTQKDKTGADVIIKYCSSFCAGPQELMAFYFEHKSQLIRSGHGINMINITNTHHAVYAEIDGEIVGHIVFEYVPAQKRTWLDLSAVKANFRRRGIYKLMHYAYEQKSLDLGAIEITSMVHVDNIGRLKSAEEVGFKPTFYRMSKYLVQGLDKYQDGDIS